MAILRGRLWRLWIVAASLLMLLARPYPVWACSCAQAGTPAEAFRQAEAVFTGTVTSIRERSLPGWLIQLLLHVPGYEPASENTHVAFHVTSAWKGLAVDEVTVRTGQGDADCGYAFTPGRQYLVYTYGHAGEHFTNICLRTNEVQFATDDLNYLQTQPPLALAPAGVSSPGLLAGVGALLALALAAAGWMLSMGLRPRAAKET